MVRRALLTAVLLVLCVGSGAATAEERPRPPVKRTVALALTGEGMAAVPVTYRIRATPTAGVSRLRAAVQVRAQRGWVTLRSSAPDRRGNASGSVVSNRPGVKEYRAVLLSTRGRVLSSTSPMTVTWTRLEHGVDLSCSATSAPVGADVPCMITVSPAVRLEEMIVVLQMRGRTEWILLEASRLRQDGTARTHVTGLGPGPAEFRVQLMRDALVRAESGVVTVDFEAPA